MNEYCWDFFEMSNEDGEKEDSPKNFYIKIPLTIWITSSNTEENRS